MTTATAKRTRTTSYATGPTAGKRITKTKTYKTAEVATLAGVTEHAVLRWIRLGYVPATKAKTDDGTSYTITGEDLAEFFTQRKTHAKEVAARRSEREAKAAKRAKAKAEAEAAADN